MIDSNASGLQCLESMSEYEGAVWWLLKDEEEVKRGNEMSKNLLGICPKDNHV